MRRVMYVNEKYPIRTRIPGLDEALIAGNINTGTYEWVMSHIWMSHVTYVNESCPICTCVAGLDEALDAGDDSQEANVKDRALVSHDTRE